MCSLYDSVVDELDSTNVLTTAATVTSPAAATAADSSLLRLSSSTKAKTYFKCGSGSVATYTVTDDLIVAPVSAMSSIALLYTFGVRDIGDLQEMTVQLGYNEGLEILRASLKSNFVLTDVFLHGDSSNKKVASTPVVGSSSGCQDGQRVEAYPAVAWDHSQATALSMKLLVDRNAQRVVFAEAHKDAVDFLFSFLALPVPTVVQLVGKEAMAGSLGNLYASVDKLDPTNVLTTAATVASLSLKAKNYFNCGSGSTTYTVTDDLIVAPVSAMSIISLLNTLGVRDIGDLQEMTVQLGYNYNEGLAILKAALKSKSVFTDVFLHSTGSLGCQDGQQVADPFVAREARARKPSSRVYGEKWINNNIQQ